MLLNNGTWFGRLRRAGGMGAIPGSLLANAERIKLWENAQRFGQYTSVPQGYQSAARAIIPTIKESSLMSARISGTSDLINTSITVPVSMSAAISGVGTLAPDSEVGETLSATIVGVGSLTADARNIVSMAATIDAGARPSAFDITQEVWQAKASGFLDPTTMGGKLNLASSGGVDYGALANAVWTHIIDSGVTAEQAMRIYGAVLAGKVSGAGTGTEVFTGLDGTTVRVTATVDASGNRTLVVTNGS